jgi:hypothetical protein
MRILTLIILAVFMVLEIGPLPITVLLLMWVAYFRPLWFYKLVLAIYKDVLPDTESGGSSLEE